MDLSERKLKILQAIIADFIRTAEPVGSRIDFAEIMISGSQPGDDQE